MLLGVRPELGDRIVAGGHKLRIYVPYGRQWYEYSLRRLQENPKIAGYVAGDLGRSLFRTALAGHGGGGGPGATCSTSSCDHGCPRVGANGRGPPST